MIRNVLVSNVDKVPESGAWWMGFEEQDWVGGGREMLGVGGGGEGGKSCGLPVHDSTPKPISQVAKPTKCLV